MVRDFWDTLYTCFKHKKTKLTPLINQLLETFGFVEE